MIDAQKALFLLCRHGDTLLNFQDKFRGWSNDDSADLDKNGIEQAEKAARFLNRLPIKIGAIFSSDLNRCVHTSAIIARKLKVKDVHTSPLLRPLDVGDFTGESKLTTSIDYYLENPSVKFPGGESVEDFRERQREFSKVLNKWIEENPKEKPLEVAHLSQVVYWEDLEIAWKGYLKDYATDKEDLIHPGGVVAIVPKEAVVPLLGENKKAKLSDKGDE
jgi:broad specificity phosphatase PhoE